MKNTNRSINRKLKFWNRFYIILPIFFVISIFSSQIFASDQVVNLSVTKLGDVTLDVGTAVTLTPANNYFSNIGTVDLTLQAVGTRFGNNIAEIKLEVVSIQSGTPLANVTGFSISGADKPISFVFENFETPHFSAGAGGGGGCTAGPGDCTET